MATWTSADLLARCKLLAMRPDLDLDFEDEEWYVLLTLAQEHWYGVFSVHAPESLYNAPALMTTADGGVTYQFPSAVWPMGPVEIKSALNGYLLIPGADFDSSADYVPEGDQIRMPGGRARTFPSGPYARYITPPGTIDGDGNEPTLEPAFARVLIAMHAVVLWAYRGGMRDPAPYLAMEQQAWVGNPLIGDSGIIATLKKQVYARGMAAIPASAPWWRSPDLG